MTDFPKVAIVILNWNGRLFLEKFLPGVLATNYPNFEIWIADNGSTDNSLTYLRAHFENIKIIELGKNYGFAEGYNLALKEIDAEYFMLLNSDIEVTPGWLNAMVQLLEKDPCNAACQPKLLMQVDKHYFEYAGASGGFIDLLGFPFCRGRIFDTVEYDKGQYDGVRKVFWATGAALLIKSKVFWEVGGFDPFFFAHQEEIDLCWRLHLKGYKIWCSPASSVYHVGGGTLPKTNPHKIFLNYRNNLVMLSKNTPTLHKLYMVPLRLFLDGIAGLRFLLNGEFKSFKAVLKGHLGYYEWIIKHKHASISENRKALASFEGVFWGSVVWEYFIRRKKYFSEIMKGF